MSEKTIQAQLEDDLDAALLNDISAEVEEREAKQVVRSIEQRRAAYKDKAMRTRIALFALTDATPQEGNEDRAEKANRARRADLRERGGVKRE